MDIKNIRKALNQYHKQIKQKIEINQLIIFGSRLQGTEHPDSDIDIVVVSKDFQDLDEDKRWDILYPPTRTIEPDIDPWGFTPEELEAASRLSTLGQIRDEGYRWIKE